MIDIQWVKQSIQNNKYRYSRHADQERQNDDLTLLDVYQALLNGRVIEQYPDTGRGESCLIVGFTDNGIPVHIVCACMGDNVVIITLYIPTPPKFKNPFERGN